MRNKLSLSIVFSYLLIGVIALLLREFWLISRNGLHVDESLSFLLSAYKSIGYASSPDNIFLTGNQLRELMWFHDSTWAGAIKDVASLWEFNRDTPHSNLYYSLLRMWFSGSVDSRSSFIIIWAGQLNILLFVFSFIFLACTSFKITSSHLISCFVCIIAFLNSESISNTIFARPYQLQETLILAYIYVSICTIKSGKRGYLYYTSYGVLSALTLLTGYFSMILVGIMSLFVAAHVLYEMRDEVGDFVKRAMVYIAGTLFFGYIIYPPYLFVSNYRKDEALKKASSVTENIISSLHSLSIVDGTYIFGVFSIIVAIAISLYLTARHRKWNDYSIASILITLSIWYLVVMFFAPYKIARYVYPAIPVIALAYAYLASQIKNRHVLISFAIILSALSLQKMMANWKIDYQFIDKPIECHYADYDNVAFVIDKNYRMNEFAECLMPDKKYFFTRNMDEALRNGAKIVITDVELNDSRMELSTYKSKAPSYYKVYIVR
ncbi:hypothetical protein ID864_16335 [Erwinia aphidicola]|uniref:hypothetical protein n=1 Tax=Erwinia aphidicola TaxID=68334 RepID=UPI001746ACCA|nr:hypothetical protein [Erwinia aphidicola]MBD1377185.1 hypothetical protein [Erwinia aphidicola]